MPGDTYDICIDRGWSACKDVVSVADYIGIGWQSIQIRYIGTSVDEASKKQLPEFAQAVIEDSRKGGVDQTLVFEIRGLLKNAIEGGIVEKQTEGLPKLGTLSQSQIQGSHTMVSFTWLVLVYVIEVQCTKLMKLHLQGYHSVLSE